MFIHGLWMARDPRNAKRGATGRPTGVIALLVIALAIAMLLAPPPAAGQAPSDPAAANAAEEAVRVAAEGAALCDSAIDRERVDVAPTSFRSVTPFRPAGFEVRVPGVQGVNQESFTSDWLVAGGVVYPQNVPAARLADRCGTGDVSPAQPLDWHRLSYLDPDTGEIHIGTGPAWSGARVVEPLMPFVGGRPLRDPVAPVWAPTCTKRAQTVRFTRSVFLLGPPGKLDLTVANVSRGVSRWPFSTMRVLLNGQTIFRKDTPGDGGGAFPAELLQEIQTGSNRLDVIMRKRRTGSCNGTRRRQIGVVVALDGQQAWNLSVDRPPPQTVTTREQQFPDVSVPYTLTNAGPSTLLEPVLVLQTTFSSALVTALSQAFTAGGVCPSSDEPSTGTYRLVCGLGPLGPGDRSVVTARVLGRPTNQPPPYLLAWRTLWDFNGVQGESPGSLCFPPAGQPDCAGLR